MVRRLAGAVALLALSVPAWAVRGAFFYDPQTVIDADGVGNIGSVPYAYATESSGNISTLGCGASISSAVSSLFAMRFDGENFGQSGPISNPWNGTFIVRPVNGAAGYNNSPTCYPPAIPTDSDVIQGAGSIPTLCQSSNAWPGWYEIEVIMAGAPPIYSSTGSTTRTSAGQWHYKPAAAMLGYAKIHVKDASGAPATKQVQFRHPFGSANHQTVTITIVGEVTLELPIGRTADMKPTGSTDWWALTFPTKPGVNNYYITVNSGGGVLSIAGSESNQAGGSNYNGPPGEESWWTNMLCEAFCADQGAIDDLKENVDTFASWGPWGFINLLGASIAGANYYCSDLSQTGFNGVGSDACGPVIHFGGIDISGGALATGTTSASDGAIDLRKTRPPGVPYGDGGYGSSWGDLLASFRPWWGGVLVIGGGLSLLHFLKPKV